MAFDFITAGIQLFDKILEKTIPDANLRQETARELAQQVNGVVMGQIALNQAEAMSPSFFISGWRPCVGWVCVGGLSYQIIARPLIQSVAIIWFPHYAMVQLEIETLMTILFGMLGLGAYRTYEKVSGTSK